MRRGAPGLGTGRYGSPRHHGYEMSAVFGAGVDIRVQSVRRDLYVFDRIRMKRAREHAFHLRHAEHARASPGYRDPHPPPDRRDKYADNRIARSRVTKFLIIRALWLGEAHSGDDLAGFKGRFEQSGEKLVCLDFSLVGAHD